MSPTALLLLAAAPADPGLAAFDALLGRCFAGEVAPGARDVQCFEPVLGGAHVRARHEVQVGDEIVYAGETIYSREGSKTTFVYLNSLGGVGRGPVETTARGICFQGTVRQAPTAGPTPLAGCWERTPGGYRAIGTAPTASTVEFAEVTRSAGETDDPQAD